jgi:hypothetical protein
MISNYFKRFFKNKSNLIIFPLATISYYFVATFFMQKEEFVFSTKPNSNPKIHISYVHYLDTLDKISSENFRFFMHFAYESCNTDVDFTIILNVNNTTQPLFERDLFRIAFNNSTRLMDEFQSCQNRKNPKRNTFLIVRQNTDGGDLCSHADLMKSEFWKKNSYSYIYYFFINSTTRGPFLPNYWTRKW